MNPLYPQPSLLQTLVSLASIVAVGLVVWHFYKKHQRFTALRHIDTTLDAQSARTGYTRGLRDAERFRGLVEEQRDRITDLATEVSGLGERLSEVRKELFAGLETVVAELGVRISEVKKSLSESSSEDEEAAPEPTSRTSTWSRRAPKVLVVDPVRIPVMSTRRLGLRRC
ncbi:hypothetical protein JOF53_006550 [Crossiella equi]|uniref:Uncharacterized protein n=1 Tax=Crossiella equi TaxID=130796 RepID=A0ABS5AM84_9PSEU|nr:hypothetical protein [Crossiella equi]MBP2477678.1 hypothetical protein [Crossiella equi]